MEEELRALQRDVLVLRQVTASLWANLLANSADDPIASARRVSDEMRADMGSMLRTEASPDLEEVVHSINDRLESFWTSVEQLVERHPNSQR